MLAVDFEVSEPLLVVHVRALEIGHFAAEPVGGLGAEIAIEPAAGGPCGACDELECR